MGSAVGLSIGMKQWVDLGVLQEACITRPETCGAAGGAVSLWARLRVCDGFCGIISPVIKTPSTGFTIVYGTELL